MTGRIWSTALLCIAPTLAHMIATFFVLKSGDALLSASFNGWALVWPASVSLFLVVVSIFAAGMGGLVANWVMWPTLAINGALMILFFAGLYAASGLLCVAEVCNHDKETPVPISLTTAPLGEPLTEGATALCRSVDADRPAIGVNAAPAHACVNLDKTIKTAVYFSAVTFSTVGYGDFQAPPRMRVLAALQAVLGFLYFGLLAGAAVDAFSKAGSRRAASPEESAAKVASDMNQALTALRSKLRD